MLHRNQAVLVVVDVQSKLLPAIHDAPGMLTQIARLIRGFRIVGAPVLITEQYRRGLGETDPGIVEAIREGAPGAGVRHPFEPIEKMTFSCMLHEPFRSALDATGRRQVVLCGMETHVCVHQTALHLLEQGYHVEIATDAVSSRSPVNREVGIERLVEEGVKRTCVEMAIFEMLEACGNDPFKTWVQLIR
ncbi:MAG: hydrolase [Candidatus Eisenbacteria bacterium]|nr:hydrolase [Candidatus Eisenbacteria bacterium]